ncbi:hypothetical protein [Acidovorax sp. sic0104]|uniref:hypothetical protein n=1 Tax=Acidovorax sp. sic0104 TaxID=2854784 RepID=UPI001C495CA3|nr:hypothetical protein [Acidovorax sp. sic0104]MBV7540357.1 hypothetical protein [Acidovorax sp. sic0104]
MATALAARSFRGARALAAVVIACGAGWCAAGGGAGSYTLDWHGAGEVLEYRSCGCADSCWVASVKRLATRQTLAQLRCDCEKAYARVGANVSETPYADSCSAFERPGDKPQAIRQALEALLGR